jgi:hypothetical protein
MEARCLPFDALVLLEAVNYRYVGADGLIDVIWRPSLLDRLCWWLEEQPPLFLLLRHSTLPLATQG